MPKNDYHIADVIVEYNGNGHNNHPSASSTQYEVNSEEVQDILSKMPHWIIRYGTTILFAMIILLFAGAFFIHYPDVIVTNVNITSSNPPFKVVAQANGRIQQIFVH